MELPENVVFCTTDPEKVAKRFKARLLAIGPKVAELRKNSKTIRSLPANIEESCIARVTISEEYAEAARVDLLSRLVQVKDSQEANTIMCGRG